jgi:DNA-binding transcriptional LysR family regulator
MIRLPVGRLVGLEALLRTKSPTAAARELGVTQSAVSKTLASLRLELADPLLLRRGDAMVLTPRAERLAVPLASALRSLQAAVQDSPNEPGPAVAVIALRDQFVMAIGAQVLQAIGAQSSQTEVRFVTYDRERVTEELSRGAVDVAVAVDPPDRPSLRQAVLYHEHFVCIAPSGRRLTLERYLAGGHVTTSSHAGYSGLDEVLAKLGHHRRVVASTAYFATAARLADDLGLLATLPARVAEATVLRKSKVYALPFSVPGFSCRLIWDGRMDNEPRHRWLRGVIVRAARGDKHR